jgi:hypothetical protein
MKILIFTAALFLIGMVGCDSDTRFIRVTAPPDTVLVPVVEFPCKETCRKCKKLESSKRHRNVECKRCGCSR